MAVEATIIKDLLKSVSAVLHRTLDLQKCKAAFRIDHDLAQEALAKASCQ
jgi:hypothetical protein